MHEETLLPCIFGCRGECDRIGHYIFCSPLWQIAGAALKIDVPLDFNSRICVSNVCPQSVQLLAIVCTLYHHVKSRVEERGGFGVFGSRNVQKISEEAFHILFST